MELQPELPRPVARGRLAAALGVGSASLLSASLVWAHHWNPLAESSLLALALAGLLYAAGIDAAGACGGG